METFSALLAICAGNSPVTGEFPAQRPVTRSFDVFLDLRPINDWVNNREADDSRRYRGHYDVSVMYPLLLIHGTVTHITQGCVTAINSLRAKYFSRNMNMYLQFLSLFYNDMTPVVEIPPHIRHWST